MRRTKAEAEETRRNILDAAERLFFAKGVIATSLEEIAVEAGVTRGAIYWHFANKADLFLAMVEDAPLFHEEMLAAIAEADALDPLAAVEYELRCALRRLAGDERRQRIYTIVTLCEYHDDMRRVLGRKKQAMDRMRKHFAGAFAQASRRGMLQAPWTPQTAASCFVWTLHGLLTDWLRFGRGFDLVAEGSTAFQALMASFRGAGSAGCVAERRGETVAGIL